ncbi:M24 family metallopeptidase [Roseicella frigidaeris]|uniref:Aminopeptidase P family protein n=1 Tax=Roseicella frigidaeris TaxID=2230885 RepID=A0A327MES6_9PROT|nr:Xaa-Pro peptidase family protein [Roseicella frigidaeris]RAI61089.1 aminopeptidase P family protein [Roseicella frigidaeris]
MSTTIATPPAAGRAAAGPGSGTVTPGTAPFDTQRLDDLLAAADVDAVVTTSRQAAQYLLGGYSFPFFDHRDAIGLSRYMPVVVYVRGRPDLTAYIAHRLEKHEHQLGRFWTPVVKTVSGTTTDATENAIAYLRSLGLPLRRIGVEPAFLPSDAAALLRDGLPNCALIDVAQPLERLRARKSPAELAMLREASERVVESMLATFAACRPGLSKAAVAERLRREEEGRDLTFEYCLITAGESLNRAASAQEFRPGDILSLDSGGRYQGYIGDLCRMGILGEPDSELQDLLGAVEAIQAKARGMVRAGTPGGAVQAAGEAAAAASPLAKHLEFLAHGMGLVQHEAPWLTAHGPIPYAAHDAERPLEADMVLSVETTLLHPKRGFIKLEDTIVVTETGCQPLGDAGRGWNRCGTAA